MAGVNVSVTSDLEPAAAWNMASDLSRFDEWMTIFAGWKSPLPAQIEEGTEVSSLIKVKGFRNTIHWTVTRYDEPRLLEPGMVFTIEPGLYVSADDKRVDAKWRGIGIRTEDDVVITKTGNRVLTDALVRDADQIEAFMAG